MFSFLFGAPKKTAGGGGAGVSSTAVDNTMATLRMLSGKESDLEKRIAMLEKQIETLKAEAVAANGNGQKQKALLLLKKKSMYEDQIKTNNAMLFKIVEQKMALESTMINSNTLSAMSAATASMKATQGVWTPDAIRDLTEEMHDVSDAHREIVDLLREPLTEGPSEDELADELAELTAAAASAAAAAAPAPAAAGAPAPTLVLPAVPSTAIPEPKAHAVAGAAAAGSEMERELAALM